MADYRCYLLDRSGSILEAHDLSCDDDQAAITRAHELFDPRGFEIWRGKRRLYPAKSIADPLADRSECSASGTKRR